MEISKNIQFGAVWWNSTLSRWWWRVCHHDVLMKSLSHGNNNICDGNKRIAFCFYTMRCVMEFYIVVVISDGEEEVCDGNYRVHRKALCDGILYCCSSDGDDESPPVLCDAALHSSFSQFPQKWQIWDSCLCCTYRLMLQCWVMLKYCQC